MKPEDLGAYYESILEKEVRKEGGVYYTPPLIVDYMIEDTLGTLLEDKTPDEIAKIKIVDPAFNSRTEEWEQGFLGRVLAHRKLICLQNGDAPISLRVLLRKNCHRLQCGNVRETCLST